MKRDEEAWRGQERSCVYYLCMHAVYMCASTFTEVATGSLSACCSHSGSLSPFIAEEWGIFTHAVRVTALTSITQGFLELQAARMQHFTTLGLQQTAE